MKDTLRGDEGHRMTTSSRRTWDTAEFSRTRWHPEDSLVRAGAVPSAAAPAARPSSRSRLEQPSSLYGGGIVYLDAAEHSEGYTRRQPLQTTLSHDHLLGGAVQYRVEDEVQTKRTQLLSSQRHASVPEDHFPNSCPLACGVDEVPPVPTQPVRGPGVPVKPALRTSGALPFNRISRKAPSAHVPQNNLESSGIMCKPGTFRPSVRQVEQPVHLQTSTVMPQDDQYEQHPRTVHSPFKKEGNLRFSGVRVSPPRANSSYARIASAPLTRSPSASSFTSSSFSSALQTTSLYTDATAPPMRRRASPDHPAEATHFVHGSPMLHHTAQEHVYPIRRSSFKPRDSLSTSGIRRAAPSYTIFSSK
eukprot:m.53168 g.53168  ORF g.53168 m.53168 type:complete len:361 (+) comp11357_c0_seq3:91-1173(+)